MESYEQRTTRIVQRINELASFSEDGKVLTRTFGSKAFMDASDKVSSWMREAGLQTHIDNIGNIRGRLLSTDKKAKTFIIASHIDSVVNAGKFDGPLGVIMGLDLVENLKNKATEIPFNIELVAFSDEEGVRFHSTYLGSKVIAGSFDTGLLQRKDALGVTVREVIESMGGDSNHILGDAIAAADLAGYFEIHIEQGPVLYERNIPAAVVTGIAGQRRMELGFKGMSGHAGTVPMDMRQDALCAAADCILEIEKLVMSQKDKLVATVGKLEIRNAASNVIPGEVACSLDVRSENKTVLEAAVKKIMETCQAVCKKRNIVFEWNLVQSTLPVACDSYLVDVLKQSIKESGYDVIELVSGAGHDAVAVSTVAPVSMLFVRCFKGISHNPLENATPADIEASLMIAEKFLYKLILKSNPL